MSPTITHLSDPTATPNPITMRWEAIRMHYDDYGTDMEAIEAQRWDADLGQAAMEREGNRLAALRDQGICTHSSGVMYRNPPVYEAQVGLEPGQSRCTEGTGGCTFVANSDAEWDAAKAAARNAL